MIHDDLQLFALSRSRALGEALSRRMNVPLAEHEERDFEDGEHKTRPLESVRNRDVFVVHSLYGEPGGTANDKLCRLRAKLAVWHLDDDERTDGRLWSNRAANYLELATAYVRRLPSGVPR